MVSPSIPLAQVQTPFGLGIPAEMLVPATISLALIVAVLLVALIRPGALRDLAEVIRALADIFRGGGSGGVR